MTRREKEQALLKLSQNSRCWQLEFDELDRVEQVFMLIWGLEAEVNNGGFEQYFWNSSGDHANDVEDACRTIGAKELAEIVSEAIAVWPGKVPEDTGGRRAAMDNLPESSTQAWNSLDDKFYSYPDDLTVLLYDFIQANSKKFDVIK